MVDWGYAPIILIFADSSDGIAVSSRCATDHGARIAAALPIDRAVERLDMQVAVDLVLVDATVDHGSVLDELLRRVEQAAAARRFASIVTITPQLLDIATARTGHEDVTLLVNRDARAMSLAVGERLTRTEPQLREAADSENEPQRSPLIDEAIRFGKAMAVLGEGEGGAERGDSADIVVQHIDELQPPDAGAIREMIRARRLREELLGPGIFADPAWDILLDLTAARIEGRPVAVSSLCIAAAVPATTALRWIKQLTDDGYLHRVADPDDGRRVFIELTDQAAAAMMSYFAMVGRVGRG